MKMHKQQFQDDALLLPSEVAAYLRVSTRHVAERYAFMPGFPAPVILPSPSGVRPHKRWRLADIKKWIADFDSGRG